MGMMESKSRGATGRTQTGTQLLDKALDMVDLIEQSNQRLSANAIALASGYPKPTVSRILSALVRRGFLAVDRRDQTYELGMRFTQMAATLRRTHRLVALVEDELIALSTRTGESVSLGIPEPTAVRIVGRYQLGLESLPGGPTGAKRPYHATAIGKAILANLDDKQMHKLVNVLRVQELVPGEAVERELALLKVAAPPSKRAELMTLADAFRARVADLGADSIVFEMVGSPEEIDAFEELVRPHGLQELGRTGRLGLARATRPSRKRSSPALV